jgi:hypothetical protein
VVTELGRAKRRACLELWALAQARFEEVFGSARAAELGVLLAFIARDLELRVSPADRSDESAQHVR